MQPDADTLGRALRSAVRTHKLLTLDQAYRYADLVGIPRDALHDE